MAVPFPRETFRYSKSGNSLFMAGSENLERYWKRPRRGRKIGKRDGGGRQRERRTILVGRKCPLGETRKREEHRLSPDPIKRKRDPLVARPPLLRVDPRDSEPANKIQINSTVHTKLSHFPLPDRVPIPKQLPFAPQRTFQRPVEIPIFFTFYPTVPPFP